MVTELPHKSTITWMIKKSNWRRCAFSVVSDAVNELKSMQMEEKQLDLLF